MGNRISRTFGTILLGKLTDQKPEPPTSPCNHYFIDKDGNQITESEEFTPSPDQWKATRQIFTSNPQCIKAGRERAKEKREGNKMAYLTMKNKPTAEELRQDQLTITKSQAIEKYGCGKTTLEKWTRDYRLPHWTQHFNPPKKVEIPELAEPDPTWEGSNDSKQLLREAETGIGDVGGLVECIRTEEENQTSQNVILERIALHAEMLDKIKELSEPSETDGVPASMYSDDELEERVWQNVEAQLEILRQRKYRQVDNAIMGKLHDFINLKI